MGSKVRQQTQWQPHVSDRIAELSRQVSAVGMALRGLQWTAEAGMSLERKDIEPVAELAEEIEERLTAVAEELGGKVILPRAFPAGRGRRVKVEPTPAGLKIEILNGAGSTLDGGSAKAKTCEVAAEPHSGRAEVDSAPDVVRSE